MSTADRFQSAGIPAPEPMGAEERAVWERRKAEAVHNTRVIRQLRDRHRAALRILADLVDPDPCSFDHHGGCLAHGHLSLQPGELCPHQEAKNLLEAEGVRL